MSACRCPAVVVVVVGGGGGGGVALVVCATSTLNSFVERLHNRHHNRDV